MIYLILVLGLILRLFSLNQSFWLDEATSALVAKDFTVNQILTKFLPGDFHPPFYYLTAHFWAKLFGVSEVGIRSLSVLSGVATIYVLYLLGKELKAKKAGIIAALLLATSGLHIYYSQEARMYSLATLFVSLTFLYFVKILKKGRVGDRLLFGLFLTLSVFTDYLPILIIPVLWISAWLVKKDFSWWKKFFASHIILIITGLLWFPTFIKQFESGLSIKSHSPSWWQILGQANFKEFILIPTKFIFGRIDMQVSLGQIAVVGIIFLFFGYLLFRSMSNPLRGSQLRLIWLWFLVPLILGTVISFWIPALSYFRFLFVLPAFYLLVAYGVSGLSKKTIPLVIGALLFFNLTTSALYLFRQGNQREDWRGLTQFIKQESINKKSAVVFVADSQMEAYRYYDKDAKILTSQEVSKSFNQLWLMRYVQGIFDPQDLARSKVEGLGYKMTNQYDFNGVVVWKYTR